MKGKPDFDSIVSNPPFGPAEEFARLAPLWREIARANDLPADRYIIRVLPSDEVNALNARQAPVDHEDVPSADEALVQAARLSQVGAWASAQSETLHSRDDFEDRLAQVEKEFEGREIPRPDGWSGYRVVPEVIEFWYGAEFRLHERWRYECDAAGEWDKRMLYP